MTTHPTRRCFECRRHKGKGQPHRLKPDAELGRLAALAAAGLPLTAARRPPQPVEANRAT